MALPNGTGGYQPNTGNPNQPEIRRTRIVFLTGAAMLLATTDLAAQIVMTPGNGAGATLTTPSGQALDDVLPNAVVGHSFTISFTNASSSVSELVTLTGGAGVTVVGRAVMVATTGTGDQGGTFRFVKTGAATWSAFRI